MGYGTLHTDTRLPMPPFVTMKEGLYLNVLLTTVGGG